MDNCIFCKIANGEIPSATVYEDEDFRAIFDISPASKGHTLIIPKKHAGDITELSPEVMGKVLPLAVKIAEAQKKALGCDGFNLVVNTGEAAGQTVHHFHMHVIPRYEGDGEMVAWKPGTSDPAELADMAQKIKAEM